MALFAAKAFISLRDSQGRVGIVRFWAGADTSDATVYPGNIDGMLAKVVACSNAALQGYTGDGPIPVAYGTAAQYEAITDEMVLVFNGATTGALTRIHVPAPKAANFAADGITVINSGIAGALIAQAIADCVTRGAETLVYLQGFYRAAPLRRRTSGLVRTPAGTGQAVP